MVFGPEHTEHPNAAKGMKAILVERGLWKNKLQMKCPNSCDCNATDCCATRILKGQPDFMEQKSLVEEVITAAGRLCIFLPKFHCELNFIEYFWGTVKKYLHEHCNYTFKTLKKNLPKAMASVEIGTIWKWEHRTRRWMDAYQNGMGAKEAQLHVKKFSWKRYTSH